MRLSGVTSMAARRLLEEVGTDFTARTGIAVGFRAMGGVVALRELRAGLAVDLAALASDAIDALTAEGRLRAGARVDYARSGIAAAVPAGAMRPAIDTAAALRAAVLRARPVAYSSGPSGEHMQRLLRSWGVDMDRHAVQSPPGVPVAALLARGEAELGFQQLSELIGEPGIDLLGMLPPGAQHETVFACAATAGSAQAGAARAFLDFLASAEAAPAIRRAGMAPA